MELFLVEATLDVDGPAWFHGTNGFIDLDGEQARLDRSLLNLHGEGLTVTLTPREPGGPP